MVSYIELVLSSGPGPLLVANFTHSMLIATHMLSGLDHLNKENNSRESRRGCGSYITLVLNVMGRPYYIHRMRDCTGQWWCKNYCCTLWNFHIYFPLWFVCCIATVWGLHGQWHTCKVFSYVYLPHDEFLDQTHKHIRLLQNLHSVS